VSPVVVAASPSPQLNTVAVADSSAPTTSAEREAVAELLRGMRAKQETAVAVKSAPARITVQLPADAKLFVDNTPCPLKSDRRSFQTPALEQGRKYYYTLRMEVERDGQTMVRSQRVVMTAGQEVNVQLGDSQLAQTER
jgi:uncharacterized protein (TIGR03000 family)